MSNTTLFVAQIVSVLTYVGIAVGLYALVIKQKDATIEFLQNNWTQRRKLLRIIY